MRYSFHGKVRATGQQVDGYVEAETSTEAIDRLADQGIIGVYSVRAEPKQPRNAVLVAGTPEFERALLESTESNKQKRRALPSARTPIAEIPPPVAPEPPPAPAPAVVPVAVPGVSDGVMLQLVDKLSTLVEQMQKFLDRPAQVIYQTGGGGGGGGRGGGGKRPSSRNISDAQNSTLKDIFMNNLDLRKSLKKLADTVTPAPEAPATNGTPAPVIPEPVAQEPEPAPAIEAVAAESDTGPVEATLVEGDDVGMHVGEPDHERHAQPAA